MLLHQPVRKTVFNVRATYQREAEKAVTHLHTLGITRIAVVHADDTFGLDALEGANKGFAKAGIQAAAVIKANRGKPDYGVIIPAITAKEAQAVLWIASGSAVAEGVKALRAAKSAAQVVTLSNNASTGFIKSLGSDAHGVIVTQVFPSVRSYAYAFVKEASGLAKEKNLELSPAMLEGYVAAKVLVEGLRRAGPNPTRAKVVTALETIRKYDLGGLELNFGPEDHTGLDFADLSIIGADGKFRR
jgi:ABC-type branched-subunit amino acid transport system substrate-binding protein